MKMKLGFGGVIKNYLFILLAGLSLGQAATAAVTISPKKKTAGSTQPLNVSSDPCTLMREAQANCRELPREPFANLCAPPTAAQETDSGIFSSIGSALKKVASLFGFSAETPIDPKQEEEKERNSIFEVKKTSVAPSDNDWPVEAPLNPNAPDFHANEKHPLVVRSFIEDACPSVCSPGVDPYETYVTCCELAAAEIFAACGEDEKSIDTKTFPQKSQIQPYEEKLNEDSEQKMETRE